MSVALPADDVPIIAIQDSFSGHDAAGAKVFTLNLMAEGAVETPAGRLIPTPRLLGTGIEERASAGRVVELKPGVNRLGFTGQAWPAHPTKGIECFLGVAFGAAIRQNAAMPRTLRVH